MARPYTISAIVDLAANKGASIIEGLRGRTLDDNSRVRIFATREAIDVELNITVGGESAGQEILPDINTVNGSAPAIPDNLIIDTFGLRGDEIVIRANNLTAGALEVSVLVFVTPMADLALQQSMGIIG